MLILVNIRIPLMRGKTARQNLKDQGLGEEYKESNTDDPMARFNEHAAGTVPMTKNSEVSVCPWVGKIKQGTNDMLVMYSTSSAVGILWSYFHWDSSSVLQGHL